MSVRQGDKLIAGNPKYHPDLFDWKWSDHILDDPQWLRSDTFSEQYKTMYQPAYNALLEDIEGRTLQSEEVAGITVKYYLADNGRKICPSSQESAVNAIFNATGVAWYYILDTVSEWFKLPRAKHNKYAAILGVVGNGYGLGLTADDSTIRYPANFLANNDDGSFSKTTGSTLIGSTISGQETADRSKILGVTTDPTKSGIIAQQNEDTDQYKYLYFYVGHFEQPDINNGIVKNIANWSSNVSNCITEIPQDIKLELNAGVLTLKAGSKVYVPNGAGVFDEVVIASDVSVSFQSWGSNTRGFIYNRNDNTIEGNILEYTYSGSSEPYANATLVWYDTTNNKVKRKQTNENWTDGWSLPFCICSNVQNTSSSIDQVFNGFGYIGSTVFALPGVKCLIPNGRNGDGSLKNKTTNDFTTVKTVQVNTSTAKIAMYSGGGLGSQTKNFGLNEPENYNYDSGILTNALEVAKVIVDSNAKITAFAPKTAFHAVDYNDTEYIAHQAMPSKRRIILTAANEAEYIAPANGYFTLFGTANTANGYAGFRRDGLVVSMFSSLVNSTSGAFEIPVRKGEVISLFYGNISAPILTFEFAQGTTSEYN